MRSIAVNPESLGAPRGYSHGMLAPAGCRHLFVAGQIGWDERRQIVGDDFALQFGQALANVMTVVREAGGEPEHVVRLLVFATALEEYVADLRGVGAAYRAVMGKHFPAMALIGVDRLLDPRAKVEIEAIAVLP